MDLRVALIGMVAVLAACGGTPRSGPTLPPPLAPDAYGHYLRGRIAMYEGDYPAAIRHLGAAAAAAPAEAHIRVAHIEALRRAGHRTEARRLAEAAQTRWQDEPAVWLASGSIYRSMALWRQALAAFGHAVRLAPDQPDGYLGTAAAQLALQQPARAEAAYRALVTRVPDSTQGHYLLARRLVERRAYAEARRHLTEVLDIDPDHIRARVVLAKVLRALGQARESIATMRQAFDRSGGDPRVGEQLFSQLLEAGDQDGAVALLGLLDRDDLDLEAKISFGYLFLQIGEHASALRLAEDLLAARPASGMVLLLQASALVQAHRQDEAVTLLLKVTPGQPGYPESQAQAAELLARRGHSTLAMQAVERALAVSPRHVELIAAHARVHELAGRPDRARAVLRVALAARPRNIDILYAFGLFEDRLGNPRRAVALMERILGMDPDNTAAMNFIGYSLADRNENLARARALLERARDLEPDNAFILDSYGWLLFRQDRLEEADAALTLAMRLVPTEPEILWHLGEVALARGNHERAREIIERARALGPEPPVLERIERIEAQIQALRIDK